MHQNPGLKKGGKITMFDWYLIKGKVWRPLGSRNSREQHAPTARANSTRVSTYAWASLSRYQSPFNEKQTPVEYLPTGQKCFPQRSQEYFKSYLLQVDPNLPYSTLFDSSNNAREAERQSEKLD